MSDQAFDPSRSLENLEVKSLKAFFDLQSVLLDSLYHQAKGSERATELLMVIQNRAATLAALDLSSLEAFTPSVSDPGAD